MSYFKKAIWFPCQSEACKNTDIIGRRSHLFAVVLSLFFFVLLLWDSVFIISAICFLFPGSCVLVIATEHLCCCRSSLHCVTISSSKSSCILLRCISCFAFSSAILGWGVSAPLLLPRLLKKYQSFWLWCLLSRSVFTRMALIYPCSSPKDIHFFSTASCNS